MLQRILKGHPNIVYLIDAAWHRLPNGTYEVFILMEFCPGGGIIDMMNRRLRERLTEPEILTIFVDVCEGLAAMHALKPPLLHRDLKVENILQSSATSYKLCDFGSATPVQKVPTNMQELRALENDLNRHTTLQYRAPEMVDVYQRRPIDEKSDVWALGVLLYKLCYYTTPFEEHGPLAILNVQYKIPPYPVYSNQMVALIGACVMLVPRSVVILMTSPGSMLREHGAQRPTVFELLNHVHALRGSKPRFTYNIPPKQPPVSPRTAHGPLQTLSPNIASPLPSSSNALDDLVTFKPKAQLSSSPAKNAGIEARDKVLEAIAPMRRGRPTPGAPSPAAPSPPPSPRKEKGRSDAGFTLDMKFGADEDKAWRGVRGHKSGLASIGGGTSVNLNEGGDAWGLDSKEKKTRPLELPGFDSDFSSSFGKGFGDAFEPAKTSAEGGSPSKSYSQAVPVPSPRPSPSPAISSSPSKSRLATKDAFDGLGLLSSQPPMQTLGDARRARTGLAAFGANTSQASGQQYLNTPGSGPGSSYTTYRPPSAQSPAPPPNARPQSRPQSPAIQSSSSRAQPKPTRPVELSAEERFPSLEDLDRTFATPPVTSPPVLHSTSQPAFTERFPERPPSHPVRPPSRTSGNMSSGVRTGNLLGIPGSSADRNSGRQDGVRSQHVTGTAMRESRMGHSRTPTVTDATPDQNRQPVRRAGTLSHHARPVQPRRHRSSISIKHTAAADASPALVSVSSTSAQPSQSPPPPSLPPRPSPKPAEQRDWLTGASDDEAPPPAPASQPVLRGSPSKRASYIERSPLQLEKPLEAESVVPSYAEREAERERERQRAASPAQEREKELERVRAEEERARERGRLVATQRLATGDRSRRQDTGRQSPTKGTKAFVTKTATGGAGPVGGLQLPGMGKKVPAPLSSSPSGLTDNWSPISSPTRELTRVTSSSSSDEGPEDINGYVPKGGVGEKTKALGGVRDEASRETEPAKETRRRRSPSKGRQGSIYDLVDLWGGSGQPERVTSPTKYADKRRSAIVTSSSMMKPSHSMDHSLPPISSAATPAPVAPLATGRGLVRPPSAQQVRKQTSTVTGTGGRPLPAPSPAPAPAPAATPSSGRARPQSMFINPVIKSTPLETHVSSSSSAAKPQDADQGDASVTGSKQRRNTRRTSISDMVQRYEAINGTTKQGPGPPVVAPKPAPLSIKAVSSQSSSTGLPSPSAAAARFPKLSPPSSPAVSKASLAVPEDPEPARRTVLQGRRSPSPAARTASPRPLPGLAKINANGPRAESAASRPSLERKPSAPPQDTEENAGDDQSGSPERPYAGVSKLIDRWQRVAEQSNAGRPPKPATGSLRGRS